MAEDPPTLDAAKPNRNNSNPQSNENPSTPPISNPSAPLAPLQIPPPAPSFRPTVMPQFVHAQAHTSYQNPDLQPPGMWAGYPPPPAQMMQQRPYQQQNSAGLRPFAPMPNGYPPPQGTMPIPVS